MCTKKKRKHCPYKPGSVLTQAPVPVIYLLRMLPCVSSVLPSIASKRNRAGRPHMAMVYMNLRPPVGTARRSPDGWWSLTPPSHPYPAWGRSFSSSLTNCRQLLLFSEVECPVPPGLSSRLSFQKRQRQAGTVLSVCKGTSFLRVFHSPSC